jgi:hypothetical protein
MDYTTVLATKPGTPTVKVEKRTADNKVFQIDCSPLLSNNELVHGEVIVNSPILNITNVSPKLGKYIRFRAEGGPVDVPYADYLVSFLVQTSTNSELSIPINIRVYSV